MRKLCKADQQNQRNTSNFFYSSYDQKQTSIQVRLKFFYIRVYMECLAKGANTPATKLNTLKCTVNGPSQTAVRTCRLGWL